MSAPNLLIIMDDEHSASALGCYGHPLVKTPNLDRLAAQGTLFENAYTNSPICVPARAVFATGQYTHKTRYWDNCHAYDGRVKGWTHALQQAGQRTTSIGKLHYLEHETATGFDQQILPMYLYQGGDTQGLVRDNPSRRPQCRDMAENIGPGETDYTRYDRNISDAACQWLRDRADSGDKTPWTTFVSFISPHYPLVAPQKYFDMYDPAEMPLPKKRPNDGTGDTEWWQKFEACYVWDEFFQDDRQRQVAIASYFGMISFIDDLVGNILDTLEAAGLDKNTRVIFLSDHGENLGARGHWGKSTMYNESVAVPMIAKGPGIPAGKRSRTPVSIVDICPSVMDNAGLDIPEDLPGQSLFKLANLPDDPARIVFSEYHATAATSACYMLRRGRYKYIHYHGYPDELYDQDTDPDELANLALDPNYAGLLREFRHLLNGFVDPAAADAAAKADQAKMIEELGGAEAVASTIVPSGTPAPIGEYAK